NNKLSSTSKYFDISIPHIPVGTVVSSSIVWNYIFYCKNTPSLARSAFNHVPARLKA
ncbi:hypothetical protein N334_03105, partial [Pelecanus crispus]